MVTRALALQFRVVVPRPVGKGSVAVRDREEALLLDQTCVAGSTTAMMTTTTRYKRIAMKCRHSCISAVFVRVSGHAGSGAVATRAGSSLPQAFKNRLQLGRTVLFLEPLVKYSVIARPVFGTPDVLVEAGSHMCIRAGVLAILARTTYHPASRCVLHKSEENEGAHGHGRTLNIVPPSNVPPRI